MASKKGTKQTVEREVIECLRREAREMTSLEVATMIGRSYGQVQMWMSVDSNIGRGMIERCGKRGKASLYRLRQ